MEIINFNFFSSAQSRNLSFNMESKITNKTESYKAIQDSLSPVLPATYHQNPLATHFISDLIQSKPNFSLDLNHKKPDIVAELLSDSTLFKETNITTKTKAEEGNFYHYMVDENGFMGEDFNTAAGLPSHFKLHKSTLEEIIRNTQTARVKDYEMYSGYRDTNGNLSHKSIDKDSTYKNIDIANTIHQYYDIFIQIIPEIKESYSANELRDFPKGFSDTRNIGSFQPRSMNHLENFQVTNVYSTNEEYKQAKILESRLSNAGIQNFSVNSLDFSQLFLSVS